MSAAEGMKDALLGSFKNNIEQFRRVDVNLATSILFVAEMDLLLISLPRKPKLYISSVVQPSKIMDLRLYVPALLQVCSFRSDLIFIVLLITDLVGLTHVFPFVIHKK